MNITNNYIEIQANNSARVIADRLRAKVMRNSRGLFLCDDELYFAIKWHDMIYDEDEATNMDSGIRLQPKNYETGVQLFYEGEFADYIMSLRSFYTGPREEWPDEYHKILREMEVRGIVVSSGGEFDCPDVLRVLPDNGAIQ